jgi:GNAT superfamily N-acetyltransferase
MERNNFGESRIDMNGSVSEKRPGGKIVYIDHLRVILIVLVVLHHAFITYGAPGSWYYQQKETSLAALFPMTVFVATNQSFFMGFFFFLSALFVEPSYRKKGAARFLIDRLKRLGVPLLFYSLILSPLLNYSVEHYGYGKHHSFIEYMSGYHHWIDFGVLWFVAALLIFNIFFLLLKIMRFNLKLRMNFPTNRQIIFIGISLGLVSFLTRLVFPTGWTLSPLGFQLGYFPQYILLFIAGLIASENKWLDQLNLKQGTRFAFIARIMVIVVLPAIFVLFLFLRWPSDYFNGGWNVISLIYSLWEQITGLMIMVALLSIAKFKWNNESSFLSRLAPDAYGVYILHPLFLISISLLIQGWNVSPVLKLLVVGPSAVASTFLFVPLIRKARIIRSII